MRYYDEQTGRWTAKDPLGFNGKQANLYVYVNGEPINYIDLGGKTPAHILGGLVEFEIGFIGSWHKMGDLSGAFYNGLLI